MRRGKQFLKLCGMPMLAYSIKAFDRSDLIDEIVLVLPEKEIPKAKKLIGSLKFNKVKSVVASGEHRQDSVYNGIKVVSKASDYILVHDGARPLAGDKVIRKLIVEVKKSGAAILAVPIIDTVKKVKNGIISATLNRSKLWAAQTPQGFKASLIKRAHERAEKLAFKATDDADLVEKLGHKVKIVMGSYDNIKVTTPFDLEIAERVLSKRRALL